MVKATLIIMAKPPVKGEVKTRLAEDIGADQALEVYQHLLEYTFEVAEHPDVETVIYFAKSNGYTHSFNRFQSSIQSGNTLGERMGHAFQSEFQRSQRPVIMLGADCPDLTSEHIDQALEAVEKHELVVGPSDDGGYYLIGMRTYFPEILHRKPWSTEKLWSETMKTIDELGVSCVELEKLNDIDTLNDLLNSRLAPLHAGNS